MQQKNVAQIMGISRQRYSILENNANRPTKRTSEIRRPLGFTEVIVRNFLNSIPINREKNELSLVEKSQSGNNMHKFG